MRTQILGAGAALAAAVLAASPAVAAVTFEQAVFRATADANAVGLEDTGFTKVLALPPAPLTQDRQSTASFHGSSAAAKGQATFTDAANGELDITNLRTSAHWFGATPPGADAEMSLAYTFTVDVSSIVRLTYDLDFGERTGISYSIYQDYAKQSYSFDPGAGFLFTDAFGPGVYTLLISAHGTSTSSPVIADQQSKLSGSVAFSVLPNGRQPTSPSPEPAAWALMIGGFGMAGGALRRRRGATSVS